jgi:hypothetical protein
MRIEGLADPVRLSIDAEAEPDVAARLRELVEGAAFDHGRAIITRTNIWAAVTFLAGQEPPCRRTEPRRVRHSQHVPGSVGWSWARVPSDGVGEFYVVTERDRAPGEHPEAAQARGLDATYQVVGHTDAAGLAALRSLPVVSTVRIKGRELVRPVAVDWIAVVGLDVAHREVGAA